MVGKIGTRSDANVIHVDSDCCSERFVFEDNITIDEVHHRLECCWGVGKAEIHYRRFEEPVSCLKGGFVFVPFVDAHVVVSPSYVEFRIDVCVTQVSYEIRNKWKGILISNCDRVDFSVILDRAQFPILFANEEEG